MAEVVIQIGIPSGNPPSYPVKFISHQNTVETGPIPAAAIPAGIRNDFLGGASTETFIGHGRALFTALQEALGPQWDLSDLSTTICLEIADPELAMLPWELMFHDNYWLALRNPIVRVKSWKPDFSGPAACWPLRMAILIGTDDEAIGAAGEERRIREELSHVHSLFLVRTIRNQDRPAVMDELKNWQPHILHFIGHGGQAAGSPSLRIQSPNAWDWTTVDIASQDVFDAWRPTLVVLNACRSADPNDQTKISALTSAFVQRGCPAVIGMQADIRGVSAGIYAGELYKNLARNKPLDSALQAARNAVYRSSSMGVSNVREAAMARLTVSVPPSALFAPVLEVTDELKQKLMKLHSFKVVSHFVNQVERREHMVTSLWPILTSTQRRQLVIVRGDDSTGKTSLACLLMDLCWRTRHKVRYIDIDDGKPKNWLDVLRLIRGKDPDIVPIRDPLPADKFHEFHWQINAWLSGKEPAVWDKSAVDDRKLPLVVSENIAKEPAAAGEPLGGAFQTFRRALASIATPEQPLIIVLDHLSGLDYSNFWLLWDGLFQPIANGNLPNVHLLLALTNAEFTQTYKVEQGVQQLMRRIENYALCAIPLLTPEECGILGPELLQLMYLEVDIEKLKGMFEIASNRVFRQDCPIGGIREFYDKWGEILNLQRRPL
jgi:hypothetical protein